MTKKILVVDDSKTSIFLQRTILKKGPYDVVTASDGQQGVAAALSERPDLILMDVVMPRMDWFQAVAKLREQAETRDIPVIMVTTRGEGPNVAAGFERGCNAYVAKPVNTRELLAKVEDCLQGA